MKDNREVSSLGNEMANLSEEQQKRIDRLEAELGVILIAYDGYKQEDENGTPTA